VKDIGAAQELATVGVEYIVVKKIAHAATRSFGTPARGRTALTKADAELVSARGRRSHAAFQTWLSGSAEQAFALAREYPADKMGIVQEGLDKEDRLAG
jgi:hypothetical protein